MNEQARERPHAVRRPETKSFILTSEFWVAGGAIAAVFLGGYALDDIAQTTAWRYGTWIAIAYILSRGIAKAGSQRSYQAEPRPHPSDRPGGFWGDDDDRDYVERAQGDALADREQPPRDLRRDEPEQITTTEDDRPTHPGLDDR